MTPARIAKITRLDSGEPRFGLQFDAGPDDPSYRDPDYQRELHEIEQRLRDTGLDAQSQVSLQRSADGGS